MVFPFFAAIGAATGLFSAFAGASAASSQAAAMNDAAEEQAEAQYDRAMKDWNIQKWQAAAQWEWDKARIAQLRFNDRQAEADYNVYTGQLIDAATENLRINQGALYDRYVVEEGLRGLQTGLDYTYSVGKLGAESTEALAQYLTGINQTALRSKQTVSKVQQESQQLIGSLAMEEVRDNLGWQLNQVTAMAKAAEERGLAAVRQGGGATAQRLGLDAAQALGRTYGELVLRTQDRNLRVDLMNAAMNTSVSQELAQNAIAMQDAAQKMKYTSGRYHADFLMQQQTLKELTIPTFRQAGKQYGRELDALKLQTQGVLDQAARPYRGNTYMDPLEPIAGLKPEMLAPTLASGPSAFSTIANALGQGFQGAMQFSYQRPGGGLGFY
jgi:hypothetical protein